MAGSLIYFGDEMATTTKIDMTVVAMVEGDIPIEVSAALVDEVRMSIRSFLASHRLKVISSEGLVELFTVETP